MKDGRKKTINQKNNRYKKYAVLGFVLINLLFVALPAFAGPFDVPSTDKSKQIFIDTLFGPLVGASSGSELSAVITIFNQAMLFVGGILVTYTLLAGTISSAHDGEMLGRKWSSVAVPLRTAIGTAAILPVLPGGFCFAQGAVVWLAMQGIGMADRLVEAYIGNGNQLVAGDTFYQPPRVDGSIRELLGNMLISNTCVAAVNGTIGKTDTEAKNQFGLLDNIQKGALKMSGGTLQIQYGSTINPTICGSVTLLDADSKIIGSAFNGQTFSSTESIFDVQKYVKSLQETNRTYLVSSQKTLWKLGNKVYNASDDDKDVAKDVRTTLDSLSKSWSHALYEKAHSTYQSSINGNFLNSIKEDGWLLFGAWYMEIAKVQDAVSKGVTNIPSGTTPAHFKAGKGFWNTVSNSFKGFFSGIDASDVGPAIARARKFALPKSLPGGAVQQYANTNTNTWTAKIVSWFINDDTNLFSYDKNSSLLGSSTSMPSQDIMAQNPVMMARNLGQNMTMAGWSAYGIAALALVVGTQSVGGVGTSGLAAAISPMITAIAGTIIVSGATLSTYIPMLPYVLWLGVALGWAILLIEAVIAAPLWAVVHLAPDGDGFVGRGGQGYMLVLSLVLRPALMVLGFISAVILMKPLGLLINSTFVGAFINGVNPSIFGLSQMIMGCVLYTVIMISIITKVFSLIHVIPDKILRWIGGGAADLGETARAVEATTGQKVIAGAVVGQQLGGAMTSGVQQGMTQNHRNRMEDNTRAQTAAREAGSDYSNQNEELNQNENDISSGIRNAQESARAGDDAGLSYNEGTVKSGIDKNTTQSFKTATAAAKSASARANVPGASESDVAMGEKADAFLSRADNVNPNDKDQVNGFMQSELQNNDNKGTSWGNHIKESAQTTNRAQTALHNIRKNYMSGKDANNNGVDDSNELGDDE